MRQALDLRGFRVGRLVVEKMLHGPLARSDDRRWLCRCDCGEFVVIRQDLLTRNHRPTRSCGCLRRDTAVKTLEECRGICAEATEAKLDVLLDHVRRRPRQGGEIYRDFMNDWGSCSERTFWRALRLLRERGDVRQVGKSMKSEGEDASMYVRVERRRAA